MVKDAGGGQKLAYDGLDVLAAAGLVVETATYLQLEVVLISRESTTKDANLLSGSRNLCYLIS